VGASGDGRIPFIDTRDIAACAAVALTRPGHVGQEYILTRSEALSYYDIARILSEVIGRPVEYSDRFDESRDRNTLAAHQRAGGKTAIVHDRVRRLLGESRSRLPSSRRTTPTFFVSSRKNANRGDEMPTITSTADDRHEDPGPDDHRPRQRRRLRSADRDGTAPSHGGRAVIGRKDRHGPESV
jgi:hypothetical protein